MNWAQALLDALAFVAGGFVAALAGVVAQIGIDRSRESGLRAALMAELRENMARLGGPEVTEAPAAPVVRTAWDQARGLRWRGDVFEQIAGGYRLAEGAARAAEILYARVLSPGLVISASKELAHRETMKRLIVRDAQHAYDAFARAMKALGQQLDSQDADH